MLTSKECAHQVISLFYTRDFSTQVVFAAHIYMFPINIIVTEITIQHIARCTEPTAWLCILGVSHKYCKITFFFLRFSLDFASFSRQPQERSVCDMTQGWSQTLATLWNNSPQIHVLSPKNRTSVQ